MRSLMLGLLFFAMLGCADSQSEDRGPHWIDIEKQSGIGLVQEYLRRDARGERLRASVWFQETELWDESPGYDENSVITAYALETTRSDSVRAEVGIAYFRVGTVVPRGDSLAFIPTIDTVRRLFIASRRHGKWVIEAPRQHPFVSVEYTLAMSGLTDSSRLRLSQFVP